MIYNKYLESDEVKKLGTTISKIKEKINFKNIFFLILSFVMSMQAINSEQTLFSFVMFAIASIFNVPLILILLSSVVGLAVLGITTIEIVKLLSFFAMFTIITSFLNIEGVSKKHSVYIKFLVSTVVLELIFNFVTGTLFVNIVQILGNICIISAVYYIFVSGVYAIINLPKGYIYSKEESVAMVIVFAMMLLAFKDITIASFSVYNVLVVALVLIYGWKSGAISGIASGIVLGLVLNFVDQTSMTYVVALGISGGLAGILSKFGKVVVVLGFIFGNVYLSYYTSGFSELIMRMSEIVMASVVLLFMPRSIELKLSSIFNKNKTLDTPYENVLDSASDVKNKIGAVSGVFEKLSEITIENTEEYAKETRDIIKKYILDYIDNSCISCDERKNCIDEESLNISVDYISLKLENNEKIDKEMLKFNCDSSDDIIKNIEEVYNSMKLMRILKQKEKENTTKLSNQYKEISKVLANISKNIKIMPIVKNVNKQKLKEELKFYGYIVYEDDYVEEKGNVEYTFVTDILSNIDKQKKEIISIASNILEQNMMIKLILNSSKKEKSKIKLVSIPEYEVQIGIANETKHGETISGDSYLSTELQDLKHLTVISDGAGSGIHASKSSLLVINMLEKLLDGGFDESKAIEIINSIIKMKNNDLAFSTLDALIIDLKTANSEYIKLGSAPTYIIEDSKIITVNNINIPVGLIKDVEYVPICKTLNPNTIVIQLSDGVIPDDLDINDNYFTKYLQTIDKTKTAKAISDELIKYVLKENKNELKDDATIIVTKLKSSNTK